MNAIHNILNPIYVLLALIVIFVMAVLASFYLYWRYYVIALAIILGWYVSQSIPQMWTL